MLVWETETVELILPFATVPASSTSADCLKNCVDEVAQIVMYHSLFIQLLSTARFFAVQVDCSDQAFRNLRYQAWLSNQPLNTEYTIHKIAEACGNHYVNLIDGAFEAMMDGLYITMLTSFIVMLRASGFNVPVFAQILGK